jgi:FixJ family two-component response regulator
MATQPQVIAVIDDDPDVLKATAKLLSALGYGTQTYSSANAFLASVGRDAATCLIVDVELGTGRDNGFVLSCRLAAEGDDRPIIFMTARDDEMSRKLAARAGGVALLPKPFPLGLLIEALGKAGHPVVDGDHGASCK